MRVDTVSCPPHARGGHTNRSALDVCTRVARGALSTNIERAVRSDPRHRRRRVRRPGVRALPARVRRYAASIAAAHWAMRWAKTASSEPGRRALQRMLAPAIW